MTYLVAFVGDTHGHLKIMYDRLEAWRLRTGLKLEAVWQVGDFGIWPDVESLDPATIKHAIKHDYPLHQAMGDFPHYLRGELKVPIPTYFTRGNHENQPYLMEFERLLENNSPDEYPSKSVCIVPNLHYVPDGHVITLGGQRIASWGGCYSPKTFLMDYWSPDRVSINRGDFSKRLNHMTCDRFELLMRSEFNILVTHEAPSGVGVKGAPDPESMAIDPEELTGVGVPAIRELIEAAQPLYQFNGHWHEFHVAVMGRTRCMTLDRVRPGQYNPHFMAIVDLEKL